MGYHKHMKNKTLLSDIRILMEDNDLIVVYKPPGVLTQEDISGEMDLYRYIKSKISRKNGGPLKFLGLIHRLDRPVAGVILMAKNKTAAANLSRQFRDGTVEKKYFAVVHGKIKMNDTLVNFIRKDTASNISQITADHEKDAVKAELEFRRLMFRNDRSLLEIYLQTGKSHQIRVQLSYLGHPIIGDRKYGSNEILINPGMIALCACCLTFRHPKTSQILSVNSPRPRHWPWYDPALFRNACR